LVVVLQITVILQALATMIMNNIFYLMGEEVDKCWLVESPLVVR
jgi:hypothetical protein